MNTKKIILFTLLFLHVDCGAVLAESASVDINKNNEIKYLQKIDSLEVKGNLRIEEETIISYMLMRPGMEWNKQRIDQSLKLLFASGLFADVKIYPQQNVLIIEVKENPIVNRVHFEGNKKIKYETLYEETSLRPRQIYTRNKIQNDVEQFIELYRRSGRFSAHIEPKIVQLPQNRVDVIFEIQEGKTTQIRSIKFIGNQQFSNKELINHISTRESRWWKVFTSADRYDPDRINYDRELLRRFYLSEGYADFRIVSSLAELTPDGKEFFITFNIEEGKIYTFNEAHIASALDIDISEFSRLIMHNSGERYNSEKIDATVDAIVEKLGNMGYAFADIRPRVKRDKNNLLVDIVYKITEGIRVYVERININNNTRTQDTVIRREMLLDEKDAFNRVLLDRSKRNIKGLGYFSSVEIVEQVADEEDQIILDVNVEEQSTGEFSFGFGYSSASQFTSQFSILERNFLGQGKTIALSASFGSREKKLNFSIADPYYDNRRLYRKINIFRNARDYRNTSALKTIQSGISLSFGFPVSRDSYFTVYTHLLQDEFKNSIYNASYGTFLEPYRNYSNIIGYTYAIDKRDDKIDPTDGWSFTLSQDYAGLVGDTYYLRITSLFNYYQAFLEDWVLQMRLNTGAVFDYKHNSLSYNNHFLLGGNEFRGFDISGIGPHSTSSNYSLGSKYYIISTLQTQIPVGIPQDIGLKPYLFLDFGFLGKTDIRINNIKDDFAFRASYGISLAWRSPLGPVRFDLAKPFIKEDYDRARIFNFTIGTQF